MPSKAVANRLPAASHDAVHNVMRLQVPTANTENGAPGTIRRLTSEGTVFAVKSRFLPSLLIPLQGTSVQGLARENCRSVAPVIRSPFASPSGAECTFGEDPEITRAFGVSS